MKDYTVVGIYSDNGQKFCHHVQAEDIVGAKMIAMNELVLLDDDSSEIAAVFEGHLNPVDA